MPHHGHGSLYRDRGRYSEFREPLLAERRSPLSALPQPSPHALCANVALQRCRDTNASRPLGEIGCTSEDIDAEGDVYFADDATCKDGTYDITLDKDFKIVKKEKDND